MRARARSRLRGGKVSDGKGDINYYRFSLSLSDADAIDIARRTLSNNAVDRRLVIKPVSLLRLSIRLGLGNHLPPPKSTSFPRNYTMFAADAPMHR